MQGYLLNTEVLLMVQMNLSLSHNVAVDPLQGIGLGVLMMQSGSGTINETTGIESIDNGKLAIDNEVYDLQGRRMHNTARKGIYIQNGKKVVIR